MVGPVLYLTGMETPAVPGMLPGMATPEMYHAARAERELYERNKPLSDEELDALLPGTDQVGLNIMSGCERGEGSRFRVTSMSGRGPG